MSFYVFLLVTSLACVSQARPSEPIEVVQESNPPATNPGSIPKPSPAESAAKSDEQKKIDELLKQVQSALDTYITPYMVNVTKEDQDILKNLGLNEFAGSVNYMLYVIQELKNPSYDGGAIDRNANDFIVELDSFDPFPDVQFIERDGYSITQ